MKFGINTWVWVSPLTTADLTRLVPKIKRIGFNWIEYPIETPDSFDYTLAGQLSGDHGLGVSVAAVISQDRDLIHPDPAIRANGLDYVRHAIVATAKLGATNLIGPLYSGVGRTWQASDEERKRDVDLLAQQLFTLAEFAQDHNVTLCLEPLNRFETSFINTAAQASAMIDQVDHPNCQMMLDTFHMNIEERGIGNAINSAGRRLRHLHACENDRGAPGTGHILWADIVVALKEINYTGPVVIESFTNQVKTIARAAAIWRPLAPSQDALAVDGLRFLQGIFAHFYPEW